MKRLSLVPLAFACLVCAPAKASPVLLISIDGLRPDYMRRIAPTLAAILDVSLPAALPKLDVVAEPH